jgi:hypothetical protein
MGGKDKGKRRSDPFGNYHPGWGFHDLFCRIEKNFPTPGRDSAKMRFQNIENE